MCVNQKWRCSAILHNKQKATKKETSDIPSNIPVGVDIMAICQGSAQTLYISGGHYPILGSPTSLGMLLFGQNKSMINVVTAVVLVVSWPPMWGEDRTIRTTEWLHQGREERESSVSSLWQSLCRWAPLPPPVNGDHGNPCCRVTRRITQITVIVITIPICSLCPPQLCCWLVWDVYVIVWWWQTV